MQRTTQYRLRRRLRSRKSKYGRGSGVATWRCKAGSREISGITRIAAIEVALGRETPQAGQGLNKQEQKEDEVTGKSSDPRLLLA